MEHRVLLHTATTKDSIVALAVLGRSSIQATVCSSLEELIQEMDRGVGALLLSEEVLNGPAQEALSRWLQQQPSWSDLPILVSARPGVTTGMLGRAFELLSNVTILDRPIRIASLASAARSALRARDRQFLLRSQLETLHEVDRRKTEFLATLAHELRNPMAPLTTTLAILRRRAPLPVGMKPYYDLMERQVDHMAKLVDDLMEVSRITRGKVELKLQRLFISSVIGDSVEISRPGIEARHHSLTVDSIDPMLAVSGDPVRLTQVFSNLLNNAARYTPNGGRIAVSVTSTGSSLTVTVRDSGMGITSADLHVIFDMFVQVPGTARAAQGGLGIGLTLVKSLVELHGGHVQATSAGLGQGSKFSVTLPIAGKLHAGDGAGTNANLVQSEFESIAGLSVLVVDDNHDAADTLGDLLLMHGATVDVAYTGAAGFASFLNKKPRVVILDIGMPGMDGYELAQLLMKEPGTPPFLVALTGWGQVEDRVRIEAAGFRLHLVKPVNITELAKALGLAQSALPRA